MKYLQLIRIKHWIKNLLLFFPIIFSGQLLDSSLCIRVLTGFIVYSFSASMIYIFNDLKDLERDKKNPMKQKRPLAAGTVTKRGAGLLICVLTILSGIIFYSADLGMKFGCCLSCYLLINIAYSMGMKNVPIADVAILSGGYLLRLYGGGILAGAAISDWMFLTVAAASFYLGFGKRRNELVRYGDKGRKLLERYTVGFLDKGMQMFLTLTVVFYALSCTDKNTVVARKGADLLWSVLVVILILLRYNMLLEDGAGDGDPVEVLQQDRAIVIMIFFYAISVFALIYLTGGG